MFLLLDKLKQFVRNRLHALGNILNWSIYSENSLKVENELQVEMSVVPEQGLVDETSQMNTD